MRHLSTLALAGLFGGLLLVGDASACHKKKCACPAPAPVCEPAPVAVCATPKVKHHFKMPKMSFGHHKTAACAPVVYETAAPVYTSPQATPQASTQAM